MKLFIGLLFFNFCVEAKSISYCCLFSSLFVDDTVIVIHLGYNLVSLVSVKQSQVSLIIVASWFRPQVDVVSLSSFLTISGFCYHMFFVGGSKCGSICGSILVVDKV
jgi:hypothetical protein